MKKITRADIFSWANAVTAAGAIITIFGATRLNTWTGLLLVAAGRALDLLDGPVARRTHTSDFGALFDATTDKVSIAVLLFYMYHLGMAPIAFLAFLLLYNVLIFGMAADAELHGTVARPTRLGKNTMFLHVATLLFFVLAQLASNQYHLLYTFAATMAIAGIIAGLFSLAKYVNLYLVAKKHQARTM